MLEDGIKKIEAKHLSVFAHHDDQTIQESIQEWEGRGLLKVLKPYSECSPEDHCIELFRFIDQNSPIKGYMNWEDD